MCHKLHKIILVLATRGYLEKRRTSENCTGTGLEMIEMLKRIDSFFFQKASGYKGTKRRAEIELMKEIGSPLN